MSRHKPETLLELLRQGWRGDTATELMREAADRIELLTTIIEHRTAQLDRLVAARAADVENRRDNA